MGSTLPEPHLVVIMGATGDLTRRKLLPALYHLARQGLLGPTWRILGVARDTHLDDDGYRAWARESLTAKGEADEGLSGWCDECLHYASVAKGEEHAYEKLAARIHEIEREAGLPGNRTFYLALPPGAFGPTVTALGEASLNRSEGFTRVVVEKPFGWDLESARKLNEQIHAVFDERQVYRIDHYLGKETVQNLLVFRFGNAIFEDLWNRDRISSVEITVAESLALESRAAFYERTGALRDIVQNHLVQIAALAAMEVPTTFDAESVHHEKVKVLRSIQPLRRDDVVFGQYAGVGAEAGYRQEPGVAADSTTETYFAARLDIDTWRWQGVPFYIRTGKALSRKLTEVVVNFRRPPVCLFESMGSCLLHQNVLHITLQPNEGFSLYMDVKEPGEPLSLRRIPLDFRYGEEFGKLPDAYETLLSDVLQGDQTLFVHANEVEASWRLFDPLLGWDREIAEYPRGSAGPDAARELLAKDGNAWQAL